MPRALWLLLLVAACEPPASVIFELNIPQSALNQDIEADQVMATFCPVETGCKKASDFIKKRIDFKKRLGPKETIAFTNDGSISIGENLFFEFVISGRDAQGIRRVLASGAKFQNIPTGAYFDRKVIPVQMSPFVSLQAIQDGSVEINTRVSVQKLQVNGIGNNDLKFFVQAFAESGEFPAYPFFSGLTVNGDSADVSNLEVDSCVSIDGILDLGDNGKPELNAELIRILPLEECFDLGFISPHPVFAEDLQDLLVAGPLDGVLLSLQDVTIELCNFAPANHCGLDVFLVGIDDFCFPGGAAALNARLDGFENSGQIVTVEGVGEVFNGRFFLLPRDNFDIF